MNISDAIALLNKQVPNPSQGLPEKVFLFISRLTPLVKVDLLIKDETQRTLLSWRDDPYSGIGWHVPGGIVRFKEKMETRVEKVAEIEIGAPVIIDFNPIDVHQNIQEQEHDIRGHFISFLYQCFLSSSFVPKNEGLSYNKPGYLKWHGTCPDNLLECQERYRRYI